MKNQILNKILTEKQNRFKGGLYHKTQINLAYNSNRIEGSKLTEEQTRYIFETRTIGFKDQEAVPIDDIIETSNHFVAFDLMLDSLAEPLTPEIIKTFQRILKSGTDDARKSWFGLGDWKKLPNEVGGIETSQPEEVGEHINQLLNWYQNQTIISLIEIADFHYRFEKIHPFQDGNGRVGRLIMFRECLKNDVMPFIIDDDHKQFYYRGLAEFEKVPEFLLDTCRSAQDIYQKWVSYFTPDSKNIIF